MRQTTSLSALLLGGAMTVACGRPATESECKEIVARITELELRSSPSVPSSQVPSEVSAAQKAFQAEIREHCAGRRLTSGAMACVRSARSAQEIVDSCFD